MNETYTLTREQLEDLVGEAKAAGYQPMRGDETLLDDWLEQNKVNPNAS